ncbi:putative peptidoglycan lipid II flippase [Chitinivorax tropicus]|uniref:Probable lipid II flippase MurJ n=1 Tax=Chitinivorax tropicus TaxID=714531 RepID=A0A840MKS4_9PROT|nr:murein biosynthesis integral membrane protein MurJ [Chitinivorax tropicus]MBB5019774.1 putative peptidoglycan lipid II flippase [Chitinivorax tropicus]
MNLLKALTTVSGMTLVSRILGFLREAIISHAFGASAATDAFFTAFKLPNLLRRIFAEGAFSQAFVPVLAEYKTQKTEAETQQLVAKVTGTLALALFVVTALGILAAPTVIYLTAPGFAKNADKFSLACDMLRVTFPYILLISLSSLAGSVLNTYNKFSIPAFTPTLLNISLILFSLWLAPYFDPPAMALAWGVFAGGVAQLFFQLPYLRKIGMLTWPRLGLKDEAVMRILKKMGPAVLGVSVAQVSLIINTMLASLLPDGSISWMNYADRLMEFPTGVLGVALGTILLPSLSKHHAANNAVEYSRLLDWGLRLCLLLSVPATCALAVLSEPLIGTLFVHGKFTTHDMLMTQRALVAYAVGLLGLISIKILAPGFYARGDTKTPVRIGMITLGLTQLMNVVFMFILPLQHAGLALSIGIASCFNAGMLYIRSRQQGFYQPQAGWIKFLLQVVVASVVMSVLCHFAAQQFGGWTSAPALTRAGYLTATVLLGAASYFAMLLAMGVRPRQFMRREH